MGKTWGDDKLRELNRTAEEHVTMESVMDARDAQIAREHAIAARHDEALDAYISETALYDQDLEELPNSIVVLPSHCGLCGYKFERPSWGTDGSKCPICGAVTRIAR